MVSKNTAAAISLHARSRDQTWQPPFRVNLASVPPCARSVALKWHPAPKPDFRPAKIFIQMAGRLACPKTPRATKRHTAPLRPGCRSIPAAKFRHSAELDGATRTALNFPPKALRTQRRSRRKWAGAHSMSPAVISRRAGFPVADNGCRPAPRPFHRPPHPSARPAAIDTTRTPDISRRTCGTDSPTAFGAADDFPGVETII